MRICFTGHRDKFTAAESLEMIANLYPGATWIHGGASGFDSQVDRFARAHAIPVEVVRPDYSTGNPRSAPIIRNKKMVESAGLVVACFDGRREGGTWFTINHARGLGKKVIMIPAHSSESS